MRKALLVTVSVALMLSVAGCSAPVTPTTSTTTITTPEPEPSWEPTYVDIVGLQGNTVEVEKGDYIELVALNTSDPNGWTPSTDNSDIVKVTNGSPNSFASVVIEALKEGSATVTVTNEVAGETVTFGVKVKGGKK